MGRGPQKGIWERDVTADNWTDWDQSVGTVNAHTGVWAERLGPTSESPGGPANTDSGSNPQSSASAGLGRGPRTCISNKSPNDADAAGPQKTL